MFRPRVIPVLLLKDKGLVKSVRFQSHRYIGDPINTVKIFNDLRADELIFFDTDATAQRRSISLDFVKKVGDEANMPFAVGGGISSINQIKEILNAGAEKVVLNTHALSHPNFIREAADSFGSSTVVVAVDVGKNWMGRWKVYSNSGNRSTNLNPIDWALQAESAGAGEVIINSIRHDGHMMGYELDLIKSVAEAVSIPVIALGGAGELSHLKEAVDIAHASAVAAGSLFIYHGSRRGILVNYPDQLQLRHLFTV